MSRNVLCRCAFVAVLLLALAVPAAARDQTDHGTHGAAAPAAEGGFQSDAAADLERAGKKLVSLAEAIPAEEYGWRPAEGVRSVSEVFVHVANANSLLPPAMGVAAPPGIDVPQGREAAFAWMGERERSVTAKEDVLAALRSSLDYATAAVRGLETPALEEEMDLFFPASRRAYVLILLTHNHEHLGQAIAYARSMGVTPPWSEAGEAPAAEGEGGN
ncbi:MAG TPA: DinB family protein [Thermoanaerobaculia bacterium]|nr:DinB family protein [Thermoanaerobaculia bacterium]